MPDFVYAGSELELFQKAANWKAYYREIVSPWIAGDVLEVGAGIGTNTKLFEQEKYRSWTCLEPDPRLLQHVSTELGTGRNRHFRTGTTESIEVTCGWDTLLYIDVLEHIEDDRGELRRAAALLRESGTLIVLAPAHDFLYTPFDASIGHFRRYNRVKLRRLAPEILQEQRICYLDCAGVLASSANRLLLRQAMPSEAQIRFWDQKLVPASRLLDPLFQYRVGKSVLAIWRKCGR